MQILYCPPVHQRSYKEYAETQRSSAEYHQGQYRRCTAPFQPELDDQSDQIFAMADPIAERIRKVGGSTFRLIGHISRTQRMLDNDVEYVEPMDMLAELREDNKTLAARLREAHDVCDGHRDIATASLIEVWIDETERRTWFLFESSRKGDSSGH